MAYTRPSVEVEQKISKSSPILSTPDLEAYVIGFGYKWIAEESFTTAYSGNTEIALTLDGSDVVNISGNSELVIVDAICVAGSGIGTVKHLETTEFTVNEAAKTVTIAGAATSAGKKYNFKVSYLNKAEKAEGTYTVVNSNDIEDLFGKPVSWNPIAKGLQIAMNNATTAINVLSLDSDSDVGDSVNNYLATKEAYVLIPLSQKADITAFKTHCETYSLPANKKERIAFLNKGAGYNTNPYSKEYTSSEKLATAEAIRDANALVGSKRIYSVFPDAGYILEERHIATLSPDFIKASFSKTKATDLDVDTYKLYAKFASDAKINGKLYKKGELIDDTVFDAILNSGWGGPSGLVTVYAPVLGYYYSAAVAGKILSASPSAPFTNVVFSGVDKVFASNDVFTEDYLNTMAEGGTFIFIQEGALSPVSCRHQLSTDALVLENRELSIVKAVDYTAKFIRKSLSPKIGKVNITDKLLEEIKTTLIGIGKSLVEKEIIKSLDITSIAVDETQKDKINIGIALGVLYPANYIYVSLVI